MKQTGVKIRKKPAKSNRQGQAERRIQSVRGKYKHLDLMEGLVKARKEERQFASKTPHAISTRSLKMLGKSAANLEEGLASVAIDLSASRKPYVGRVTTRPRK